MTVILKSEIRTEEQQKTDLPGESNLAAAVPELAVIVPVYREVLNISPMIEALEKALKGLRFEIIFVDDNSKDGTSQKIREEAASKNYVRGLLRVGRYGLSGAVIEGILASSAPFIVVIDGDLQHDETRIPVMLQKIKNEKVGLVIAVRKGEGGTNQGLAGPFRRLISDTGNKIASFFLPVPVSDPMSGFFMIRRDLFETAVQRLQGTGFKILVDILLALPKPPVVAEVSYGFKKRLYGESKLDFQVMLQFILMLALGKVKRFVPENFIFFISRLLFTVAVNLVFFGIIQEIFRASGIFAPPEDIFAAAALLTLPVFFIVSNFFAPSRKKYRQGKLFLKFFSFLTAGSPGILLNIITAGALFSRTGGPLACFIGALAGSLWLCSISTTLFWL